MLLDSPSHQPDRSEDLPTDGTPASSRHKRRRRRGATMMEYLVMLSFVLLIIISAVGYFGEETRKATQESADKIQKATGGNGP
jgi:hypothetical protein